MFKLIEKLLTIKDDPNDPHSMDRAWRYGFDAHHNEHVGAYCLGLTLSMIRFQGIDYSDPRVVQFVDIGFVPNPLNWKLESEHIYYDGPNCFWQIGPLTISKRWGFSCKTCLTEKDL